VPIAQPIDLMEFERGVDLSDHFINLQNNSTDSKDAKDNSTEAEGGDDKAGDTKEKEEEPLIIVEGHDPLKPPIERENKDENVPSCFEAYESCRESKKTLDEYEGYRFYNRTLGTIMSFFAFTPMLFFWILVFPWGNPKL